MAIIEHAVPQLHNLIANQIQLEKFIVHNDLITIIIRYCHPTLGLDPALMRCRLHIRCLISFLSLFVLLYLSIFVFLYLCIIAFEQPVGRRPQSRRLSSFSIWTGTLWRPTVRCRVPPAQVISTAASGLVKGLE